MSSIDNIKNQNNLNLNNFLQGNRSNYTVLEEKGFQTTGNIGSLLNVNENSLKNVHDGIMLNLKNETDNSQVTIGRIKAEKFDWQVAKHSQPTTPQLCNRLYSNNQLSSELLPYYPNSVSKSNPTGIQNKVLTPDCNMKINGEPSPTLYGISTAFVNDISLLTDPYNNIGNEVNQYGLVSEDGFVYDSGMRSLGQGRSSCKPMVTSADIPLLKTTENKHKSYYAKPISYPNEKLYQVGDWTQYTSPDMVNVKKFNDSQSCQN